jgi:hypothetical protein
METAQNPASISPPAARTERVDLDTPIQRGEQTITSVVVREPRAPELRGLGLREVMNGDANALFTLLTRITVPPLVASEVNDLGAADLAAFAGAVSGFFMSSAEKAAMAAYFGMEAAGPEMGASTA